MAKKSNQNSNDLNQIQKNVAVLGAFLQSERDMGAVVALPGPGLATKQEANALPIRAKALVIA